MVCSSGIVFKRVVIGLLLAVNERGTAAYRLLLFLQYVAVFGVQHHYPVPGRYPIAAGLGELNANFWAVRVLRVNGQAQHPHSPKIGIQLTKASSNWITPWHGVVVLHPENGYVLQKKQEAVSSGATLIYRDQQPYYYTLEDNA